MENKFPRGIEVASAAVIENDEGLILLTRSPKWKDKWTLPGGHVEPGETIMEACIREGEEETGLKLIGVKTFEFGELIDTTDFHRPGHFVYFDSHCKVVGGELKLDMAELTEHQWLSPEDALKLDLAASYRESIEAYITYRNTKLNQ